MEIQQSNFGTEGIFKYEIHRKKYEMWPHIHQHMEMALLLDGEMNITVNGKTETARSGQVMIVFPFQSHSYLASRESYFIMMTFSPALIPNFMRSADGKIGDRSVFAVSPLTRQMILERIIDEQNYANMSIYTVLSCLYALLADFSRQIKLVEAAANSHVLSRTLSYMNEHFMEDLTLSEVAHTLGYTANYLSNCIQISSGLNYRTLLACIRVEHAKTLLIETDKSMLDITLDSGFGSERSFHRQFLNITGLTPGKYRATNQMQIVKQLNNHLEIHVLSLGKEKPGNIETRNEVLPESPNSRSVKQ